MRSLLVTLPLPPKLLSPNSRADWRAKAAKTQLYRSTAKLMGMDAVNQLEDSSWLPLSKAVVSIEYYNLTARKFDRDNIIAMMKSAIDGLVDAGILVDDNEIDYASPVRRKDASNPRVELFIAPKRKQYDASLEEEDGL